MARKSSRNLWTAKLSGKSIPSASLPSRAGLPFSGCVLGIDPSLRGTGLAVATFEKGQLVKLLETETVSIAKNVALADCAGRIWLAVDGLLQRHKVDCVAMEQVIYVQNNQTALIMGAARGAAMAAASAHGLEVFEYPPLRIKQAVTGMGRATKEQVAKMVRTMAGASDELPPDEADAAAAAICHAATERIVT